jgi:hypothetical protein
MRRPEGVIDAVAASWTIGSEEDGARRNLASVRLNHLDLRALRGAAGGAACAALI